MKLKGTIMERRLLNACTKLHSVSGDVECQVLKLRYPAESNTSSVQKMEHESTVETDWLLLDSSN